MKTFALGLAALTGLLFATGAVRADNWLGVIVQPNTGFEWGLDITGFKQAVPGHPSHGEQLGLSINDLLFNLTKLDPNGNTSTDLHAVSDLEGGLAPGGSFTLWYYAGGDPNSVKSVSFSINAATGQFKRLFLTQAQIAKVKPLRKPKKIRR